MTFKEHIKLELERMGCEPLSDEEIAELVERYESEPLWGPAAYMLCGAMLLAFSLWLVLT